MPRVLSSLRAVAAFWIDFIAGDDWRVAAGVIGALAATAALTRHGITAWWLMPLAAPGLLGASLWRVVRTMSVQSRHRDANDG